MPASPRRAILTLLAVLAPMAACGDSEPPPDPVIAEASAPVLPSFQQEVVSANAEVTLPGVWQYGYRLVEHADTTLGSFRAIEFHYAGDSARKIPQRLLLVIRAYEKATWAKVGARQPPVAIKLAERGNEVYAYSIVTSNPYPVNTAAALRVDAMMLALMADGGPFRMTFK